MLLRPTSSSFWCASEHSEAKERVIFDKSMNVINLGRDCKTQQQVAVAMFIDRGNQSREIDVLKQYDNTVPLYQYLQILIFIRTPPHQTGASQTVPLKRNYLSHRKRLVRLERIYRVIRNDCPGFNTLSVWNELDYRVDVCRITKGAHIEQL